MRAPKFRLGDFWTRRQEYREAGFDGRRLCPAVVDPFLEPITRSTLREHRMFLLPILPQLPKHGVGLPVSERGAVIGPTVVSKQARSR